MRLIKIFSSALAVCLCGTLTGAQQPQESPFFELIINGENFVVRKNRPAVLESKETPGVVYDVAIFTPPPRQMDLNTVRFNYDWLFTVHDNRNRNLRRVRLVHKSGFTIMITDLGGPLPPDKQVQATTDLVKHVLAMCKEKKDVRAEDRHKLDLDEGVLRGAIVRYTEPQEGETEGVGHSMLVQTLCGKEFAVTCISDYLDNDFEDIKQLIKQTVESFRPIPAPSAPPATKPGR